MTRRAGWSPTRRNRNIGTAKAGHGQNNAHRIPDTWDKLYWEELGDHRVVERAGLPLVVCRTLADHVHACTPDDIGHVLGALPRELLEDAPGEYRLAAVVLRQPTRREALLEPVWGRQLLFSEAGALQGPMIQIAAVSVPHVARWPRSLDVEQQREVERLRAEAAELIVERRHVALRFDLAAARRVQLYRTLLHELGHWRQFIMEVALPAGEDWDREHQLSQRYWARPTREREDYAHAFAEQWGAWLRERGVLPFPRRLDKAALEQEGLTVSDFVPGER
ncbi:MAG: hypothetical protein H6741_31385 [Alphaproteobacteria bacterium]|nr:hypothetical protein [Alphaproteobacteria bacterium]